MPLNTPNRGYPYPVYTDVGNFPARDQALATAIDTDMNTNLKVPINLALDEPSARASRPTGVQVIPTGVNTNIQFTVENYDNNGIVNLGTSATDFTIQTVGTYLITCSVNIQPDGTATGTAALILTSSGGVTTNPIGTSRQLDNDKDTSLTGTTLHRVGTVPETINMLVRHNHGANLNASIAQLTVTRISA